MNIEDLTAENTELKRRIEELAIERFKAQTENLELKRKFGETVADLKLRVDYLTTRNEELDVQNALLTAALHIVAGTIKPHLMPQVQESFAEGLEIDLKEREATALQRDIDELRRKRKAAAKDLVLNNCHVNAERFKRISIELSDALIKQDPV